MARVTVGVAHDSLTIGQNLLLFIGNCLHIIEISSCKTKQPKQTNNQTRTNLGKKYQLVHSPLMKTYHDLTDSNKSLQRRMYMYQRQKVYNCLILRLFRCLQSPFHTHGRPSCFIFYVELYQLFSKITLTCFEGNVLNLSTMPLIKLI